MYLAVAHFGPYLVHVLLTWSKEVSIKGIKRRMIPVQWWIMAHRGERGGSKLCEIGENEQEEGQLIFHGLI